MVLPAASTLCNVFTFLLGKLSYSMQISMIFISLKWLKLSNKKNLILIYKKLKWKNKHA